MGRGLAPTSCSLPPSLPPPPFPPSPPPPLRLCGRCEAAEGGDVEVAVSGSGRIRQRSAGGEARWRDVSGRVERHL